MEKNQYKLFLEVARRLDKAGILKSLVLIGSWCIPFYESYFKGLEYITSIRTRDLDFLVPEPGSIRTDVKVADLLKDLGFTKGYRGHEGYIILEHPDLAVEFLVPEKGRGLDKPFPLPKLGLNAQSLRFMELLSRDTISVKIGGVPFLLPHPINFALHKILLSGRRSGAEKADKDFEAGLRVLNALIAKKEQRKIRKVYTSLPRKWQTAIAKILEKRGEPAVVSFLKD